MKKTETVNIDETMRKLEKIAAWFAAQETPNIEEGLKKMEEAARLLSASRERLSEIENALDEVKKMADQ